MLASLLGCTDRPAADDEAAAAGERAAADATDAWNARCADAGLDGRLYASVGPDAYEAVLAEVELCPLTVTRIAEPAPLYELAAGGGVVAVGGGHQLDDIHEGLGLPAGPERVSLFTDGEVTDIPGLGSPRGGSISVSEEGTIAFSDVREATSRIMKWDPGTQKDEAVAAGEDLGRPAWGPNETLAITQDGPEDRQVVTVYGPDGSKAEHNTGLSDVRRMEWAPGELAVLSPFETGVDCCDPAPPQQRALFMDMTSGAVVGHLPRGWQGVTWSPDGDHLLVVRDTQVGVTRPPEGEITVLGQLPGGGLHDAAWIE